MGISGNNVLGEQGIVEFSFLCGFDVIQGSSLVVGLEEGYNEWEQNGNSECFSEKNEESPLEEKECLITEIDGRYQIEISLTSISANKGFKIQRILKNPS